VNDEEWLIEAARPQFMVCFLGERRVARTKSGRRKLRLFACACCRVAWDTLPDDRLREAVSTSERFADGDASRDDLATARAAVERLADDSGSFGRASIPVRVAVDMAIATTHPQAYEAAFVMTAMVAPLAGQLRERDAERLLCGMIRCVFDNPFRPVAFDPSWRSSTAVGLALSIYESRDFATMPILADALEEAGCDEPSVLAHCRGDGPHVRGCWVVDLVLGKS
jgi:hypothetical protein